MARAKPKWRRVLNTRFLRWWLLSKAVRFFPGLGGELGFFPDSIGVIEGADRVLADRSVMLDSQTLLADLTFLRQCEAMDARAPEVKLPHGIVTGRRTALYTDPWIDASTASVLLPGRSKTVLVRGEVANWNATSARLSRPRVPVAGRVFAPLNTGNYFHLLLENGMRLLDLLDSRLVADRPLTVVKEADRGEVEKAMYQGIARLHAGLEIRHVPDGAIVEPDEAVIHFPYDNYWEWPPVSRAGAERLAAAFDAIYGEASAAQGAPALYLSRAGAKLRAPLNEAALEAALAKRGIKSFAATDTNHAEQIARFRAARLVVAVHGAGLTNLLFCAPGTRVIEIFPSNFVKSTYWRLARELGLHYRAVIGGPGDYAQRFVIDPGAVEAALDEV